MQEFFVAVLILNTVCLIGAAELKDEKVQKYDAEVILKNDKAVQIYVNCFVNQGSCPKEANEMKEILPEAFTKDCGACEKNLKANTYRLLNGLLKTRPELYAKIEKVYDPEGALKKKLGTLKLEGDKNEREKKVGGEEKKENEKNEGEKKREEVVKTQVEEVKKKKEELTKAEEGKVKKFEGGTMEEHVSKNEDKKEEEHKEEDKKKQ